MSPSVSAVVEAAVDLAWRPLANLSPPSYGARLEAHRRLIAALRRIGPVRDPEPELAYVIAAARRVALCSFANRMGPPYYDRRAAVLQLRGCLAVWERSIQ